MGVGMVDAAEGRKLGVRQLARHGLGEGVDTLARAEQATVLVLG